MRSVQRVLDANYNRAAEGMRVLEDLARFMLDLKDLCDEIKACRHKLRFISHPDIIHSRDIGGDVGAELSTPTETTRQNVIEIAIAAGNRCAEALRVVEEVLKLEGAGEEVEAIRYRMYELASSVVLALGSPNRKQWNLCFVLTTATCMLPWRETLDQVLNAGCDCVQIREKTLTTSALIAHTVEVVSTASKRGAAVIVNDRVDVAMAAGASGVHLGETDMSIRHARQICTNNLLIGATVHRQHEAEQAIVQGADYLGIGPVFDSPTKPDLPTAGLSMLTSILGEFKQSNHLAIGGITPTNAHTLFERGCNGVAMCSSIASSSNPGQIVTDTIAGVMQPS